MGMRKNQLIMYNILKDGFSNVNAYIQYSTCFFNVQPYIAYTFRRGLPVPIVEHSFRVNSKKPFSWPQHIEQPKQDVKGSKFSLPISNNQNDLFKDPKRIQIFIAPVLRFAFDQKLHLKWYQVTKHPRLHLIRFVEEFSGMSQVSIAELRNVPWVLPWRWPNNQGMMNGWCMVGEWLVNGW